MSAYPLLIKHLLHTPMVRAPDQEIVYRDLRRHTYREFRERIGRLASGLSKIGVDQGDVVAILEWDSDRYHECYFAIPMMGAVLQTVNVSLIPEDIAYMINDTGATTVLFNADFLPLMEKLRDHLKAVKTYVRIWKAFDAAADPQIQPHLDQMQHAPIIPDLALGLPVLRALSLCACFKCKFRVNVDAQTPAFGPCKQLSHIVAMDLGLAIETARSRRRRISRSTANTRRCCLHVAEQPLREGEIITRRGALIVREPDRQAVVAVKIVMIGRPLHVPIGTHEVAREKLREAEDPPRNQRALPARLPRGDRLHRGRDLQHPSHVAPGALPRPLAVENREPFHRVAGRGGDVAGPFERGAGFRRVHASALEQRCRHVELEFRAPLAPRGLGLHVVVLRQRRQQRLRFGDLRHFRRRRKAFERRREHGVGVGGAALDRASRAKKRRGVQNCAPPAVSQRQWRSGRLPRRARGSSGAP